MDVRINHELEPAEAARRIRKAAHELGLEAVEDGPQGDLLGAFRKGTPMGAVSASWQVTADAVEVKILQKPAFLPGGTVAKLLEDGLADALAKE